MSFASNMHMAAFIWARPTSDKCVYALGCADKCTW